MDPIPPPLRTFYEDKPTLLVSWWCTLYAIAIIFVRVCGRYVRAEKLFAEDAIMLLAIIPLLMRMAFVHVVLVFGTNNTQLLGLDEESARRREIGSQVVLVARVMYAAYLWAIKYSTSLFLRTLTESVWQRRHQRFLRYLHIFLAVTFLATVISDLAACQPFSHYWQVIPDPGPQCRQGYAHLLTTGVLNTMTTVVLIGFPVPMIVMSRLPLKRKFSILLRLLLPLVSVAFTLSIIPRIISHNGSQQIRSLLVSIDILLATIISNAVVLLSLLQDRGYKKEKYKHGTEREGFRMRKVSTVGTVGGDDEGLGSEARDRERPRTARSRWGSDENLMGIIGESEREGDGKVELIGLDVLKNDGTPELPQKVKLHEIRVASTWEVHVERDTKN